MDREEKIKIISNYCKLTPCSKCKIAKEKRCEEEMLTYQLTIQEMNTCLELIGKSIYEHNGCVGCKHETKTEKDDPCKKCRLSMEIRSDDYYRSHDLYEPAGEEQSEREEPTDNNSPIQILSQDNVNHPAHYSDSCSLECIQVMRLMFGNEAVVYFCLCNAFKYLWRYKHKNGDEDLKKAEWYLSEAEYLGFEHTSQQVFCDRIKNLLKELKNE